MKRVKWIVLLLFAVPVSAFAVYKPARLLLPQPFGVSCHEHNICVDDIERYPAAAALLHSSKQYLQTQWGLSPGTPRVVFCSTPECRRTFGVSRKAGYTLGSVAVVIAPRGWQRHYVAHELIHYWQNRNFGSLAIRFAEPWLIEGMAYALSGDPRSALAEPFESYRQRFRAWYERESGLPFEQAFGDAL